MAAIKTQEVEFDDSQMSGAGCHDVVPIVLAGGDSTRMGYPKALLPLGEKVFVTTILDKLEQLALAIPVLVLGRDAVRIQTALAQRRCHIIINHEPQKGQLSSIQLGLASLDPSCSGCLIWPVDQPAVPCSVLIDLLRAFKTARALITIPCHRGRRGHPAIFRSDLFRELLELPPGDSPKGLVMRCLTRTAFVETTEISTVEDVDTPEDYYRLTSEKLETVLARMSNRD